MSQLAIFTAPKPFKDPHIQIIQRNAVQSWKVLGDEVEVWLVGNEQGVEQAAHDLEVGCIPDVQRNNSGTPRIDSIFASVREKSSAPLLCYVNADILLFTDFLQTLTNVRSQFERFLIIGRRWDAPVTMPLEIKPGWHRDFVEATLKTAKLHRAAGSDYFIFPREEFMDIPTFAVGRAGWDNWMIYKGRCDHMAVIDATDSVVVIHQNHDFSHFSDGKIHRLQPESVENLDLAGGRHTVFTIHDSNYKMVGGEVQRVRLNRWKLAREISIFPSVVLHWSWLARITYTLFNLKRVIKDRRLAKEKLKVVKDVKDEKRSKPG